MSIYIFIYIIVHIILYFSYYTRCCFTCLVETNGTENQITWYVILYNRVHRETAVFLPWLLFFSPKLF